MKKYKPDVTELVIKMQQQLVSLERKIDTLISRPQDRPFESKQRYPGHGEIRQDRGRGERTLHKAICADCNKECEVPFRPSQDRPVYCKECFAARKPREPFKPGRQNLPREVYPARERPFDRYRKDADRKPAGKKKPVFKKRKK